MSKLRRSVMGNRRVAATDFATGSTSNASERSGTPWMADVRSPRSGLTQRRASQRMGYLACVQSVGGDPPTISTAVSSAAAPHRRSPGGEASGVVSRTRGRRRESGRPRWCRDRGGRRGRASVTSSRLVGTRVADRQRESGMGQGSHERSSAFMPPAAGRRLEWGWSSEPAGHERDVRWWHARRR